MSNEGSPATRLPVWRRIVGIALIPCIIFSGLLAMLMLFAGCRWLFIEWSDDEPLRISLAFLGGATIATAVSIGLLWLAMLTFNRPRYSRRVIATIVTIICVGGVVLAGSFAGLLYMGFNWTDAVASPRVDAMFSAIENNTLAETYETDTSEEFRSVTSKEQYEQLGKAMNMRLGALKHKSLEGFYLQQCIAASYIDATYNATFEKGVGMIKVRLKRHGDEWKLVSIRVQTPDLEQDMATVRCESCGEPHSPNARFCPSCGARVSQRDRETD